MMTHTPGPWGLHERVVAPFGHKILARMDTPEEVEIADTYSHEVGAEQDAANARLMIAAPDLLEALEECREALTLMLDSTEMSTVHDFLVNDGNELAEKVSAAIAAAKGGV